ncbi:MAG: peptidoglycan DD-metalloendopeptidase family protein [Alphaproteobacteria bacterium]
MGEKYGRFIASGICISFAVLIALYDYLPSLDLDFGSSDVGSDMSVVNLPEILITKSQEETQQTTHIVVGPGDTFGKILALQGLSAKQVHNLVKSLRKVYKPRQLRPGHELDLVMSRDDEGRFRVFDELRIRPSLDKEVMVIRDENDDFQASERLVKLDAVTRWMEAPIDGSLYEVAYRKGVPGAIIQDLISVFSYDVDFQRSIKKGDSFGLMYTILRDPQSGRERPGHLLYGMMKLAGKPLEVFRFAPKNGDVGYYNAKGESVKKGLLRTPVDGARLSGRFGMRKKHPVLGYSKMHRGVDFAARTGTPIKASGDGTIERIGRFSSFGNYIRIRHNSEYKTAYAHLSRYAKGLRKGSKVKQGQVIGYVGSTGRATGPHLHYEVHRFSKQINPLSVKMISSTKLKGKKLKEFQLAITNTNRQYASLKKKDSRIKLARS